MPNTISMINEAMERLKGRYHDLIESERQTQDKEIQSLKQSLRVILDKATQLPPTKKKRTTIPAILNKSYQENLISDLLAYVLRPTENGIGVEPLRKLIKLVDLEYEVDSTETVVVVREYDFRGRGRIDILIRIGDRAVVGIENKIFSDEGDKQTEGYQDALEKEFPEQTRFLLFLTPQGTPAGSKHFAPISYTALWEAFRDIQCPWSQDVHAAVLFDDFLNHIEDYIMPSSSSPSSSPSLSERGKLYLENHKLLEELRSAFDKDLEAVFNYVTAKLESHVGSEYKRRFFPAKDWQHLLKPAWEKELEVHYEYWFDKTVLLYEDIDFMVDVEGKGTEPFFQHFQKVELPKLTEQYKRKGIVFRPSKRKQAIARKTYHVESVPTNEKVEAICNTLTTAWDEFKFLTEAIDATFRVIQQRK